MASARLPKWAFPLGLIVLAIAAFLVGSKLASSDKASYTLTPSGNGDATLNGSVPVTELPDGKGEGEEEVQEVPAYEFAPDEISWLPLSKQVSTAVPPEIRQQIEKYLLENANSLVGCGPGGWGSGPNEEQIDCSTILTHTDTKLSARKIGGVVKGRFDGFDIIRVESSWPEDGLFGVTFRRFDVLFDNGTTVVIGKNAALVPSETLTLVDASFANAFGINDEMDAAGMKFVKHEYGLFSGWGGMSLPWDTKLAAAMARGSHVLNGKDISPLRVVSTDAEYTGPYKDLVYLSLPDGDVVWYKPVIPFMPATVDRMSGVVPQVVWADGTPTSQKFMEGQLGGCGFTSPVFVRTMAEIGEMKAIGTVTVNRVKQSVYAPIKVPEWLMGDYKYWQGGGAFTGEEVPVEQRTEEKYLSFKPVFLWKDTFGRYIEFRNVNALPAAECGKPVIYLYPEQTTDVSVKVDPKGGFTYTDPEYGSGWNVVAKPDGSLTNKADGKTYPYLFWEGRGGLYQSPEKYWVVAKADVPSFITSTLSRLGLNEKEIADFNEFWLPRMEGAAYYKIGFHGTRVMDQLAPLDISPRPDSIFRVLMDYEELAAPIEANPPALPRAFVRDGFTVVEWGGVLR